MTALLASSDDQGRDKCLSLERDRKKKQDRRGLTRKLLEDLEGILPSDGTAMRRTLHRILEDCIAHVKSARSSSGTDDGSSQMPPELWKEGLSSSRSLGVGALNSQFCFTECNAGLSDFFGMDSSAVLSTDFFSLFQPQDGIHLMQRLNRQRSNGLAVQETARLANGGVFNVVVTKSGSQSSPFFVVMSPELGLDADAVLDACGQKRPRSEAMGIQDLESAVSSALKKMNPSTVLESQETEKAKPDVPYHPYLHGLKNFGNSPSFNLFDSQPNVAPSPLVNQSNMASFAANVSQLPSNSALAQYVQALSASQTSSSSFGLISSSSEPSPSFQMAHAPASTPLQPPTPPQNTLPSVSSLNLPVPFLPGQSETTSSPPPAATPALQPMGAKPRWSPAPAATAASPEEPAAKTTSPVSGEGGPAMSYTQQLKLQEQVERQYRQLNDLTRQLSTMQELLTKHIPTFKPDAQTPPAAAAGAHDAPAARAEAGESAKAGGEGKEGKAGKGERGPRKMPSTRNATIRWTREEHLSFLKGLERLGTGQWSSISKYYVPTRTPAQVASHHQKFAIRSNMPTAWRQKPSILDVTTEPVQKLMTSAADRKSVV